MKRFIARYIAMFRLLWLTPKVKGEFSILKSEQRDNTTFVLLPDNADTQAPGIQSLFWNSRKGHCVVELSEVRPEGRWFKVLKTFGKDPIPTKGAWLSGWLGENPEHFGINNYDRIRMFDGTQALLTKGDSYRWVIHVHGRKTLIGETLRNFPMFDSLGFSQMAISHQTDPKPAGLGKHKSTLGITEWELVDQAVSYAKANGAREVILFGWSLGGMICGQYLKRASDTSIVRAAIFESPMFDVRNTLRLQAGLAGYSDQFADEVIELIGKSFLLRLLGYPVMNIDSFSLAKNSIEADIPMLVLYSLNDGYIQIKDALKFAEINQNVMLQEFEGARHCRLRNSNIELYENSIKDFVAKL